MIYRFGIFEFDDRTAILARSDRTVPLEPQPARALALLLSRAGTLVTREELRGHLWGQDTHVDFDRGLAYCIGQLRAALGDAADNPRFVQTLPRRGFTFIAPVTGEEQGRSSFDVRGLSVSGAEDDAHRTPNQEARTTSIKRSTTAALTLATAMAALLMIAGAAAWGRWRPHVPDRPIVAVAVFDNETGDASRERAVSTIADLVVERLTALGPARIGVNGNSKVLRNPRADRDPRMVARETHAAYLVAGHLQTRNGRLSLLMHIIRLDDGTHVWVQRISRAPDEGLESLDEDVAAQIETAIRRIVLKDGVQIS
jgi:DNA-binding winged helix-turn-helix (wHTH) protein/TolB-like protein